MCLAIVTACAAPAAAPGRWLPKAGDTWQWQLSGPLNTRYEVAVYDIDLFDTTSATIDALHAEQRHVVCYFSAGTAEDWRPDFASFAQSDMGVPLAEWPDERWLDTRSRNVREIMRGRLQLARDKGCDGVEPDNVDAYQHDCGFDLDAVSQLEFNRFLAAEAHARGLAVGLKNDIDQIRELAPDFDFAVNEQCFEYNECGAYADFTAAGKPVFNAEYAQRYQRNEDGARDALCRSARAAGIHTLVLAVALDDSLRFSCD